MSFSVGATARDRGKLKSHLRNRLMTYSSGNNPGAMEQVANAVDAVIDAVPEAKDPQAPLALKLEASGHFDSSGGTAKIELTLIRADQYLDWPLALAQGECEPPRDGKVAEKEPAAIGG